MKKEPRNIEREAGELAMSQTFERLAALARSMPMDVGDKESVRTALSTCAIEVIRSIDAGRLKFERDEDSAFVHGLLCAAISIATDGTFGKDTALVLVN